MIYFPMVNHKDRSYEIGNHQAPHSWGFLFVGGWVDLDMTKRITLVKNEKMDDL